ncbi:HEXXH motif domain-containing protein [Phytohabitans sp. ZYX-F-186]|uniref:HEXXH motif domain-containing protein n=1 Tax=Phytohabitans maris TaxID=3071409 RepID=A0ABU0ZB90_9ACTN|nr:HEXXH motif domain-containing protein [Phytohabitans sp. ZYX-F-186]MDQ7904335.1 HEXXH motif domain-containing protein [Phytohabitans sp. ZYX-F-186]
MPEHLISAAQFGELAAGYGGRQAMETLLAGQISRGMLLLRAVLAACPDERLPGDALTLIADAQREDPAAVESVLAHPFFAAWATNRVRAAHPGAGGDPGRLFAYAATAAIRAGLDFELAVPVRGGALWLPGLGLATGLGAAPSATVRNRRREGVVIGGSEREVVVGRAFESAMPGWLPLRIARAGIGDESIALMVEDLDPYRDLFQWPLAPRLSDEAVADFQRLLGDAWTIVTRDHPEHAIALRTGLRAVVPLVSTDPAAEVSAASRLACGSIGLAVPSDAETLAMLLIHEFQHMKLGALLDLVPLYRPGGAPRHRAPWRPDPRPAGALLQGAFAHIGVTDYWRLRRRRRPGAAADLEFGYWLAQTIEATDTLDRSGEMTDHGRRFVTGMARTLRGWRETEELPPGIRRAVDDMSRAGSVAWRLRNVRPAQDSVERVLEEWRDQLAGHRAQAPSTEPSTSLPLLPGLARLVRQRTIGRSTERAGEPAVAYLRGDWPAATRRYQDSIAADPDDHENWVGLSLAAGRLDPDTAVARALAARPELVRAAYRCLRGAGVAATVGAVAERVAYTEGGSMSQLNRV